MIIDISQEILGCKVYPGDPSPKAERLYDMEKGDLYNMTVFSMCAHNGTHVDAPAHFIKGGKTIDQMDIGCFAGPCWVAYHSGDLSAQTAADIVVQAEKNGCRERILIAGNMTVTADAAKIFADSQIKLIGNESQSVGPADAPMEVHKILLSKDIVLLEGIVLEGVTPGRYYLCCTPLNITGAEGSPCRAILIKDEI